MRVLGISFAILLVILGVAFAALNAEPVLVKYLIGRKTLPLAVVIVIAAGMGFIIGLIIMSLRLLKLRRRNHQLQTQIKRLEKQLPSLK
jgi:putative membrane protein